MASSSPTFLGIPAELRLRIYELVPGAEDGWISIRGSTSRGEDQPQDRRPGVSRGLWPLARVCRIVSREVVPLLPHISDISIVLASLREDEMRSWLEAVGEKKVKAMRQFTIIGEGKCSYYDFANWYAYTVM